MRDLEISNVCFNLIFYSINSAEREVVVLRGSPEDASSHLLCGNVVVNVPDPSSVKKVSLKFTGTMRLKWIDHVNTPRGMVAKPVKHEKTLVEHEWPNLLYNSYGNASNASSSPSGGSPSHSREASSTNLAALSSNTNIAALSSSKNQQQTTALELPFELVIPGDTAESVEGMSNGSIIYRLQATVERGRFSNNLVSRKLVRIVRTIGSDSFDLTQSLAIENTWPNKVDYSIEIPSKAVPIGSYCKVHFLLVPLLKRLKLGSVKTQLVEYITLATPTGSVSNTETTILETKTRPKIHPESSSDDHWNIYETVTMPSSLTKCTQDCHIGANIKVSHKLKFGISLINPDGHTSELRASLPLYLFISPNINVSAVDPTVVSYPGHEPEEEPLFDNAPVPPANPADSEEIDPQNLEEDYYSSQGLDINAPPNYHDHIYDRLWSGIPTANNSGATSPTYSDDNNSPYLSSSSRRDSMSDLDSAALGMSSLDQNQRSQLTAGLQALENYQRTHGNRHSTTAASFYTGGGGSSGGNTPGVSGNNNGDYFSSEPMPIRGGNNNDDSPSASGGGIDIEALSRVPSYSTAVRQDGTTATTADLAPGYDAPSLPGSPNVRPGLVQNTTSHVHTNLSSSLPGSSANLHRLGGTLNSLRPLTSTHHNNNNSNNNNNAAVSSNFAVAENSGESSSRNSTSNSHSGSSTNLRSHNRNSSSSALSSLLHRSASSKSLFEGLLKRGGGNN